MRDSLFEELFGEVDTFKAETLAELTAEYEELSDELLYWLTLFRSDNDTLVWASMREYLTASQLRRFKRYIGEDRVRVRKIDALTLMLETKLTEIHNTYAEKVQEFETKLYEETYYKELYESQREQESYWYITALLVPDIVKTVLRDWTADRVNFVERIGMRKDQLVDKLHKLITQTIIRGESPETIIKEVQKQFDISKNQAKNLINTESTRIVSAASYDAMRKANAREYVYSAILDTRTSDICRSMNGRRFKITEYEIGVTAPPLHSHCRSAIKWLAPKQGVGDSTIHTYTDWFEKYIRK